MFIYKINVIDALAKKGMNTNYIRINKIISENSLQKLRKNEMVGMDTLEHLCRALDMQPGSIIEYMPRDRVEALIASGYFKKNGMKNPAIKESDK